MLVLKVDVLALAERGWSVRLGGLFGDCTSERLVSCRASRRVSDGSKRRVCALRWCSGLKLDDCLRSDRSRLVGQRVRSAPEAFASPRLRLARRVLVATEMYVKEWPEGLCFETRRISGRFRAPSPKRNSCWIGAVRKREQSAAIGELVAGPIAEVQFFRNARLALENMRLESNARKLDHRVLGDRMQAGDGNAIDAQVCAVSGDEADRVSFAFEMEVHGRDSAPIDADMGAEQRADDDGAVLVGG